MKHGLSEETIRRVVQMARSTLRAVELAAARQGIVQDATTRVDYVETLEYMLSLHDAKENQ